MAEAKKCNRCERLFDPANMDRSMIRFEDAVLINQQDFIAGCITSRLKGQTSRNNITDLCPSCAEDFMLFMDNHPLAARVPEPFIPEDDPNKGYSTKSCYFQI